MLGHIYDVFMFNDELDILECRLYELQDVPNVTHVVVEANVTHQDNPKDSVFLDHRERFAPWKDRIAHIWATGLPTKAEDPDPWAREHAQREHGLKALVDAEPHDVVLHGDVDEIPTSLVTRNLLPAGLVVLEQRLACFAVDWLHPDPWRGPVAARVGTMRTLGQTPLCMMRDSRNVVAPIRGAGWHLSWLGGKEATLHKLACFCHPEIADRTLKGLEAETFMAEGYHVDGSKLMAVDVDRTWPRWVVEKRCPASWWRPR